MLSSRTRYLAVVAGLAVSYVVTARLGLALDAVGGFATLVWPPTGIAIAALLGFGWRAWPGVAIGAVVVNAWVGADLGVALGIGIGNTLEAVVAAVALRRLTGFRSSLDRVRDVVALLAVACVCTAISATFGTASLAIGGVVAGDRLVETWRAWWVGDLIGATIITPLLLVWSSPRTGERPARFGELVVLVAFVIGAGVAIYAQPATLGLAEPYLYAPLLIWAAVRFGQRGAVTATFAVCAIAVCGTALGHGPFVRGSLSEGLLALQSFTALSAATFLVLGATIAERERAQAERALEVLELRVRERTAELRDSESRKAAILETSLDCIVTIDHLGAILEFNPAAEATFGIRRVDAIGRELADLMIPQVMRQAHRDGLAHYLATGDGPMLGKRLELPALRGDGTEFPAEISLAAIPSDPPVFTAYLRDVTVRKQTERELEQAVHARDELISTASHELRSPLSALQLQVELLKRMTEQPGMANKVEAIGRQITRLNKLVDNLLEGSRIGAGRLELELEDVDLVEVVREVVERHADEMHRAGIAIALRADPPIVGRWDRMRIDQIVTNLLSNAIKYGDKQPIEISAHADDRAARLVVRDHGVGIPAADHARVFERFERLASKRHTGGFGLGLWIVREIVDGLDGTIRIDSVPNEGATFTVELPRSRTSAHEQVLVVEDDVDILDAVIEALRAGGYSAVAANNGKQAIDRLRRGAPPAVILLDLAMPVMDGEEFLRAKQQAVGLAPIPVVLMSADDQLDRKAGELDVAGFIKKPVDLALLLSTVGRYCPRPRAPR